MPGMLDWKIKISADIKDLQNKMHKVEGKLGEFEGKDHKVKLDLDTKTLESALKKLDSMLDSLGKGTGDFKQFETLSKDLAKVTSELSGFTKAFGKIDDSGTKSLLDMVQNIDKSLNNLSSHVTDEFLNKITSSVGTVKQKFADIGDGSEFEPLLQMINKIDSSINNLAKETSKIKLNMNLDFGTEMSEKMNQQVSKAVSRQAQAYKNLFEIMKGSGKTTEEMIKFSLPENASNSEIVGAYKGVIERAEKQYGKSTYSLRLGSKYNDAKNEVKNANAALRRAEIKRTNSNGVSDLLGGNFGDVINELSKIAAKLDEISSSASGLKSAFETGFNVSASVEEIAQLTNKVKKLEDELQKVKSVSSGTVSTGVTLGNESNISSERKDAFPDKDISASVESATNSIKEENNVLEQNTQKVKENTQAKEQNTDVNLNKYDKRLDSYNGKVDKYQATIDRFNDGGWTSDTYLKNVQAVRDAIKQYATLLDNIKTNQNGIASDEDIQNLDKYEKKIKDTIATVTNMSAAEKGYNFVSGQKELDKIHKLLVENSKMSSEAKAKIKAYYAEIESGNPSMSLDKIHGEILKIYNAEVEAGRAGKSMWSAIKEKAWYGAASAIGTYFGVNDIFRYGKEIADTVIQLDTATTELRKVSDATDQRLVTNFKNSANTAKQLGSTISDVISATADWSRMGYDIDQAEELARVSTLYKNVGDGIDIETANNSLISTLQGFQLDASQAESIIDKFNEVANNYAIDSAGIGEALQRSAASFNAANTDLSKSIALITATNEVVQDPDSVGTLWKTMSARIRGAETELSELNEETDEYTKTTSKLRDLIKSLTGFDIMADEDTFKDIYDIILGIGKEWNNLTDAEQSSLGEALAGKRNANALYAVLGNLDTLQSAYKTAENSAGSAQREQENYQKSIQYSIDQTKAKLEELSADFLSSDFLKGAIDAGGKLIDILDNIVKSGNAIPAVATAIAAAFSFKNVGLDKNVLNSRPHTISYMV